ncbi:MAG TPA: M48 family metallopeptidase [Solirubrobacteraceae bacterium]|jgi:Zn-dependent protease with chaperone function|nr:M48 family metallopeptidase [Solirubrobacteraceae bacterium]
MSSLPAEGYQLKGISPKAYEHPADRAATAALKAIPYMEAVVRKLIELGYERALRQAYLGSSVRLGEDQLADVWLAHTRAYATLDLEPVPDLYLTQMPLANAITIGAGRPIVVVQSGLVRLLDVEQLRAVFAHEAGHVLSDHVLYRTALAILLRVSAIPGLPLPLLPLRTALMEWYRAAELSCDRAAALVTRDPLAVCRTLMVVAAGAEAEQLDLDVFMRQGIDYREQGSGLERLSRLLIDLNVTHPMPVRRVHELMEWVKAGGYDRIVGGEYQRRDEPVRARAEAGEAVAHYSERFRAMFQEAAESVGDIGDSLGDAGRRLSDWLHGRDAD